MTEIPKTEINWRLISTIIKLIYWICTSNSKKTLGGLTLFKVHNLKIMIIWTEPNKQNTQKCDGLHKHSNPRPGNRGRYKRLPKPLENSNHNIWGMLFQRSWAMRENVLNLWLALSFLEKLSIVKDSGWY